MTGAIGLKISVCVLTYNHVQIIESTLKSILDQTITGFEVIVSDDCSNDGTWECILGLAAKEPRITAVRTRQNMGMPGNANFAVAQSSRPYIALLHHDDLCRNDLLEKWAGVLERNSNAAFVFNSYGVYDSDHVYSEPLFGECIDGEWLRSKYLFARWDSVVRGTAMIRREVWEQVGGMRTQFGLYADIDLWMRLCMRWDAGYVPQPIIIVRQERPAYYPETYRSDSWSWLRQRYLYEVHGVNRLEYLNLNSFCGRMDWWHFRLRLSLETTKWIIYAVVRRKNQMLASSGESATRYDLLPLRLFRRVLLMSLGVMTRIQRGIGGAHKPPGI
jgi:glycosyltransferase involved in cell wall biosynthesis